MPTRAESLTFSQTSLVVFVYKNYVTPLPPLENQFSPHLGLIPHLDGLVQANRGWEFDF